MCMYIHSVVFYYCGTLNGVTVQLFFHHFQGQTSDNELLHWMMMMLSSAAFVIVGICFVKKGGGREYPFHFDKCNKTHVFGIHGFKYRPGQFNWEFLTVDIPQCGKLAIFLPL